MSSEKMDMSRRGVTQSIRERLNFMDERLWKRFSARRLELIDTLDLSSKKASEQDDEVKRVAETLRIEFNYPIDNFGDFEKLVRAAVQSVRRNRKRSSKSKRIGDGDGEDGMSDGAKRTRIAQASKSINTMELTPSVSPTILHHDLSSSSSYDNLARSAEVVGKEAPGLERHGFLSEISKLHSDTAEDIYDMNYPKSKMFTPYDQSKSAINLMIEPRIRYYDKQSSNLPMFQDFNMNSIKSGKLAVRSTLLNYIERSKSCSESATQRSIGLEYLGKGVIETSIAYIFAVTFSGVNEKSLEYLRGKINDESYLSNVFRNLDQKNTEELSDKIAVISFNTLIGGCAKDFGVEKVVSVLCDLFYYSVIQDYPLVFKNSTPSHRISLSRNSIHDSQSDSLNSLATVAADIRMTKEISPPIESSKQRSSNDLTIKHDSKSRKPDEKRVEIRFLSSVLSFRYSMDNSATPRLVELIENARSAFKLTSLNDSTLGVKTTKGQSIIKSDNELERIFRSQDDIDLEIFIQRPKAIPIYEITSTVVPNKYSKDSPKIILPPPVNNRTSLNRPGGMNPLPSGVPDFKFLSNSEETTPQTVLPKFQPLL